MPYSVCRTCLKDNHPTTALFDQEETEHYKKLIFCTKLDISQNDGYPTLICDQCVSELSVSYDFIVKCHQSDSDLKEKIKTGFITIKSEEINSDEDVSHYEIAYEVDVIYEQKKEIDNKENVTNTDFQDIGSTSDTKNNIESVEKTRNDCRAVGSRNVDSKRKQNGTKRKYTRRKILVKKEKPTLNCTECGLNVKNPSSLIIHMRSHNGEKPFCCQHCGMKFSQSGTLKLHIKRKHTDEPRQLRERPFKCDTCGTCFFSRRDLKVHTRRHTGERPYQCDTCNQKFIQVGELTRHIRMHTGERPFKCKLCPKAFADSNLLRKHQTVHTDERLFSCSICGLATKARHLLVRHLELHQRQQSVCELCGIVAINKDSLKRHKKRFHSEKSGKCEVCNKNCSDLVAHMRKHTGEIAFTCTLCGKGFPLKLSLAVHMQKHNRDSKTIPCPVDNCSKKFSKDESLKKHMLKSHSDKLNADDK